MSHFKGPQGDNTAHISYTAKPMSRAQFVLAGMEMGDRDGDGDGDGDGGGEDDTPFGQESDNISHEDTDANQKQRLGERCGFVEDRDGSKT